MRSVAMYMKRTQDTTFLSDGERRHGNALFELCAQTVRTGKRGRPRKDVAKKAAVCVSKQGQPTASARSQASKYQAPSPNIPTPRATFSRRPSTRTLWKRHNAALRRRNSAFRRGTNTYAKNADALQRTLDVHLLQHNFIRPHWTTGEVPAVRLGIMATPCALKRS